MYWLDDGTSIEQVDGSPDPATMACRKTYTEVTLRPDGAGVSAYNMDGTPCPEFRGNVPADAWVQPTPGAWVRDVWHLMDAAELAEKRRIEAARALPSIAELSDALAEVAGIAADNDTRVSDVEAALCELAALIGE